jgi:hypothetical protein
MSLALWTVQLGCKELSVPGRAVSVGRSLEGRGCAVVRTRNFSSDRGANSVQWAVTRWFGVEHSVLQLQGAVL